MVLVVYFLRKILNSIRGAIQIKTQFSHHQRNREHFWYTNHRNITEIAMPIMCIPIIVIYIANWVLFYYSYYYVGKHTASNKSEGCDSAYIDRSV